MNSAEFAESLREFEQAIKLDPRSPVIADNFAIFLIAAGRNADSRAICEAALDYAPDHPACLQFVALLDLIAGEFDAAQSLLERMAAVQNPSASEQGKAIVDALARGVERHALAQKLAALPFNSTVVMTSGNSLEDHIIAAVLMLLGEQKLALDFMDRNSRELGTTMSWAVILPLMDPIRCEPRFMAIIDRLKVIDPYHDKVCAIDQ